MTLLGEDLHSSPKVIVLPNSKQKVTLNAIWWNELARFPLVSKTSKYDECHVYDFMKAPRNYHIN